MDNDKNEIRTLTANVKKYAIGISLCIVLFAVLAFVVSDVDAQKEELTQPTTTQIAEVEAEVTNVPDTRVHEIIVVPATEITEVFEENTEERTTEHKPFSYSLPLGTDIGKDYSRGVPVYCEVMGDWRTHDGVDFNGSYGDGVKAIADGVVKEIEDDPFMGGTVVIDHGGGVVATYCGVEVDSELKRGVTVSESEKIGEVSFIPMESDAEFPHLHLEIRTDGELCDPLEIMGYFEE